MIAEQVAKEHLGNSLHTIEHVVAGGSIDDVRRETQLILVHGVVSIFIDLQIAVFVRCGWIVIAAFAAVSYTAGSRGAQAGIKRIVRAAAAPDIETQLATEGVPVYRSNESTRVPTGLDDLAVWHGVYRNGPIRLALRHVGGQLQYHNGTNDYPLQGMGPATFAYVTPTGAVPMRLTEVAGGRVVLIEGKAYRWESGEVPPVASPTGG